MMLRWILLAASVIFQSEAAEEDVGDAFATAQLSVSEVFDGNPLTSDEVDGLYNELADTWGGDLQLGALSQELDLNPKEVPALSLLDTTALPPLPELGLLPSLPDHGQLPPLPDLGTSFLSLPSLDFGEASGAVPTGWQDLASLDAAGPTQDTAIPILLPPPLPTNTLAEGLRRKPKLDFDKLTLTGKNKRYKEDLVKYLNSLIEKADFRSDTIKQKVLRDYQKTMEADDRPTKILDLEQKIEDYKSQVPTRKVNDPVINSLYSKLSWLKYNYTPLSRLYERLVLDGHILPLPDTYESYTYATKRLQGLKNRSKKRKRKGAPQRAEVSDASFSPLPDLSGDIQDRYLEGFNLDGFEEVLALQAPLKRSTPNSNDSTQSQSALRDVEDMGSADFEPVHDLAQRQRNKRALEVSDLVHFAEHFLKLLGEPYVMEEMSSDEIISDRLKSALAVGHYSKHPRYDAEDIDAIGRLCHRLIEKRVVPELDVEGARRKKRALASAPAAAPPPASAAASLPALPDFNEEGQTKKGRSYQALSPEEKEARQKKMHIAWIRENLHNAEVQAAYSAIKDDPERLEKIRKLRAEHAALQLMEDSAARNSQLKSLEDSILETKTAREELSALCEQLILDQTIKPIPPNFAVKHGINVFSRSDVFFTGMQTNTKARTENFKPYDQLKNSGKRKRQVKMRIAWIKANLNKPDVRKAYKAITADPERLEKVEKTKAARKASKYIKDPGERMKKYKALENKIRILREATTELNKVYEKVIEEGALPPVPPSFAEEWRVPIDCIENLQAVEGQKKRASSSTGVEDEVLKRRRVNVEPPDFTPSSASATARSVSAPDARTEHDWSKPILCAQGEKTTPFHELTKHQQRENVTSVFVDWLELHKKDRDIQEKYRGLREEFHSPRTLHKKLKELCIALIYEGKIPTVTEQFAMERHGVPFSCVSQSYKHLNSARLRKESSTTLDAASAAPGEPPITLSAPLQRLNNPPPFHTLTSDKQSENVTKVFVDWLKLHNGDSGIQEECRKLRESFINTTTLGIKLKDLCIALIYEGKIPEVTEQFAMESRGVPFHRIKMGMARQHPNSVRSRKEHSARKRAASAAPVLAASSMGFSPSMWPLNNPSAPFYHPMIPVFPGYGVPFQMGPYGQQVAHMQMMSFWPGYGVPVQMAQTPLLQQWTAPFNSLASAPAEMDVDDSGNDN